MGFQDAIKGTVNNFTHKVRIPVNNQCKANPVSQTVFMGKHRSSWQELRLWYYLHIVAIITRYTFKAHDLTISGSIHLSLATRAVTHNCKFFTDLCETILSMGRFRFGVLSVEAEEYRL